MQFEGDVALVGANEETLYTHLVNLPNSHTHNNTYMYTTVHNNTEPRTRIRPLTQIMLRSIRPKRQFVMRVQTDDPDIQHIDHHV